MWESAPCRHGYVSSTEWSSTNISFGFLAAWRYWLYNATDCIWIFYLKRAASQIGRKLNGLKLTTGLGVKPQMLGLQWRTKRETVKMTETALRNPSPQSTEQVSGAGPVPSCAWAHRSQFDQYLDQTWTFLFPNTVSRVIAQKKQSPITESGGFMNPA